MGPIREKLRERLVSLVEEYFPKGDKSRGKATVMMSLFLSDVYKELDEAYERLSKMSR